MQKWTILIVGIGPTFPSVEQSNELVGALLEQGYNVKQAVFTGDSPGESANLLAERDEKIAAGKDITIKPRLIVRDEMKPRFVEAVGLATTLHPELEINVEDPVGMIQWVVEHVEGQLDGAAAMIDRLTKSNEQLENERNEARSLHNLSKLVVDDLTAKLEAATTASPLAASAVADHEAQPTEENTKPEAS